MEISYFTHKKIRQELREKITKILNRMEIRQNGNKAELAHTQRRCQIFRFN